MKHIKTIEEARALPEIQDEMFEEIREQLPDGTTRISHKVRKICPQGVEGDNILLFVDLDGRPMKVFYTEDGPAKTEFRL